VFEKTGIVSSQHPFLLYPSILDESVSRLCKYGKSSRDLANPLAVYMNEVNVLEAELIRIGISGNQA